MQLLPGQCAGVCKCCLGERDGLPALPGWDCLLLWVLCAFMSSVCLKTIVSPFLKPAEAFR